MTMGKRPVYAMIDKCFLREKEGAREWKSEARDEIHKRRRADTKELDGNAQRRRLAIFAKLSELNRIMSSR